jgi:hypothetical protein
VLDSIRWLIDKVIESHQRHKKEQKEKLAGIPRLQLHIGHQTRTSGWGYDVVISNKGDEPAYNIRVYLPGITQPACSIQFLSAHKQSKHYFVPLSDESPYRREPHSELKAYLVFENKYGEQFTYEYPLIQEIRKADPLYKIELDESKEPILKP